MKKMTRTIRCLIVMTLVLLISISCFADGVSFKGRDFKSMRPIIQNEQRAVISHQNGYEKMLIAISLNLEDQNSAIWIFPVPGKPEIVKVDVLDLFPRFFGKDPRVEAYKVLAGIRTLAVLTQIYPVFTCFCLMPALEKSREGLAFVHGTVEKWGIHAETVTAESLNALSNYLREKKVGLDPNQLKSFERYLIGDYVLVVVWIDSKEQLTKQFPEYASGRSSSSGRWPCLYVEFPSQKAFYPLIPTSVYGDEEIPIDVITIGYFAQDAKSRLKGEFRPGYYKQSKKPEKTPLQLIDDLPEKNVEYTRFRFYGSAKDLTDDLWLKPSLPPGIAFAEAILKVSDNPFILFGPILCYIAILSYFSAGIAGFILYRKWRGFDLLGFCNVFTIVAVYFTARWAKNLLSIRLQNTNKTFSIAKYLTVFSIVFILLNYLLTFLSWILFFDYTL
jgi:hypothetical protein